METSRLNNFKKQLKQYNEKFLITNDDNLITATSTKFIEPTIEEKELDLIKFHQQMLKNNNIQLLNKFKETKRNEIKKYKETHSKKEANKPITPYRQEIINTLNNSANGFNLALTLNFNPVNLSGLFNLQMVQNKVNEWWKLKHQTQSLRPKYQGLGEVSLKFLIFCKCVWKKNAPSLP